MSIEVWATRNACGVWGGARSMGRFALCVSWARPERFIRVGLGMREWTWRP